MASKVHTLPRAEKPAPASITKNVEMTFVKSTPGTHVYAAPKDSKPVCTQVYLSKSALGDTAPERITLTVSYTA
jgi:hypothetical protein